MLPRCCSAFRGKIVVSNEGNQAYINMLFFESLVPESQRKVPVILGTRNDVREGDVLIRWRLAKRPTWIDLLRIANTRYNPTGIVCRNVVPASSAYRDPP